MSGYDEISAHALTGGRLTEAELIQLRESGATTAQLRKQYGVSLADARAWLLWAKSRADARSRFWSDDET